VDWQHVRDLHGYSVFSFFSSATCITYTTLAYIYNILLNTLPKTFIVRVDFRPGGQLERQWTGIDVEEEYDGVGFVATTAWPGYR
jgi:hypothetical protein